MFSRRSGVGLVVAVVLAAGVGVTLCQPLPSGETAGKGKVPDLSAFPDFIPVPTPVTTEPITLGKFEGEELGWLSGRKVTVRYVLTAKPTRVLPLYVVKDVKGKPAALGTDAKTAPAEITVSLFDAMQNDTVKKAVFDILRAKNPTQFVDPLVVSPEDARVTARLSVSERGTYRTLGGTDFTRENGRELIETTFLVPDPECSSLIPRFQVKDCSIQFSELFPGLYLRDDLMVTRTFAQRSISDFKNVITKGMPPGEKAVFVSFGGDVNQDAEFRRSLLMMTTLDVYTNRDALVSPAMIEAVLNMALKQAGGVIETERKLAAADDDKWISFVFGNGMTVSGAVSTIRSIKAEDRRMLEKLMKDKKTWETARNYFAKLGTGMEVSGLFKLGDVKGHFDAEVKVDAQDKGSAEREDYSKEMNDVFRAVEGDLKVASLNVVQLEKAGRDQVDLDKFVRGTFIRGTRTLRHTESLQQLKLDGGIPPFKTLLERRIEKLEEGQIEIQRVEFSICGPVRPLRQEDYPNRKIIVLTVQNEGKAYEIPIKPGKRPLAAWLTCNQHVFQLANVQGHLDAEIGTEGKVFLSVSGVTGTEWNASMVLWLVRGKE